MISTNKQIYIDANYLKHWNIELKMWADQLS